MLSYCVATDGQVAKDKFKWTDISKVHIENYIGQDEVVLSLFFYSTGKAGNNKPFRYHKRISIDLAMHIIKDINGARKIDSTTIDSDDPLKHW